MTQEDTSYLVSLKHLIPPGCMHPATWANKAEHWQVACGKNTEFTVCVLLSVYV